MEQQSCETKFSVPRSRGSNYGRNGLGSTWGRCVADHAQASPNPANAASAGRAGKGRRSGAEFKGAVMLEKAKNLLQPSARSAVPPFMVMDVVAAAARLEAQGRRIVHMEVGQPAAGAPATAIAAVRAALHERPSWLYRDARHRFTSAAHRAGLFRMARPRCRSGARRRHHRLLGRLHARISRRIRGR